MKKYIEIYKNFMKRICSEECCRITMTKDIYSELGEPGNTTTENYLKFFKDCMINSSNLNNRNSYIPVQKTLANSPSVDLYSVHYRMYMFLVNHHFIQIKYDGYKEYKFIWNIPKPFLPIFISYVLASNFRKKEIASVNNFFAEFDSHITHKVTSLPNNQGCTKEEVDAWVSLQLGRNYFCNLELLISEKAKTSLENAEILRNDISVLTDIQTYTQSTTGLTSIYVDQLLKHFHSQCSSIGDELLFNHKKSFLTSAESNLIDTLVASFFNQLKELIIFVRNYPKDPSNSTFPIAVKNYDNFKTEFLKHKAFFSKENPFWSEFIKTSYDDLHISLLNQAASEQLDLLSIDGYNLHTHSSFLSYEFSNAASVVEKTCNEFLKKVMSVSKATSKRNRNAELALYNVTNFAQELGDIFNNLTKKINENFNALPAYTSQIIPGKHIEFSYSYFVQNREELTKLLNIIYPETHPLTQQKAHIIDNLSFPFSLETFISALDMYENHFLISTFPIESKD